MVVALKNPATALKAVVVRTAHVLARAIAAQTAYANAHQVRVEKNAPARINKNRSLHRQTTKEGGSPLSFLMP